MSLRDVDFKTDHLGWHDVQLRRLYEESMRAIMGEDYLSPPHLSPPRRRAVLSHHEDPGPQINGGQVHPPPTQQESQDMPNVQTAEPTATATIKGVVLDSAKLAAGMAAAEHFNAAAVNFLTGTLVRLGIPQVMLELPGVQALLRVAAPLAITQVVPMVPDLAKHSAIINRGCTLAMSAELGKLMVPVMSELKGHLAALVEAATALDTPAIEG